MPAFDPYHKWLGISPEEQPPNYYRLLGINPFESDATVISNAADQRMAFLKSVQTSDYVQLSQDLLNQVAQAKLCLLDAGKRLAYDETLRQQQTQTGQPTQGRPSDPQAMRTPSGQDNRKLRSTKFNSPELATAPLDPNHTSVQGQQHKVRHEHKSWVRRLLSRIVLAVILGAGPYVLIVKINPAYDVLHVFVTNPSTTLDDIENRSILEDAPEQTVQITGIGAAVNRSSSLRVSTTSSNTGLISKLTVSYTAPATTGNLKFAPRPDQYGTATITVTVEDGGPDGNLQTAGDNATCSHTFDVTVRPVNDPPTLDPILDVEIAPNAGPQTIGLTGMTAGGGESQFVRVKATSSHPTVIPPPTVTYVSPDDRGSLTFTPLPNQTGTATITVTVEDGAAENRAGTAANKKTCSQSFAVTVRAELKPPLIIIPVGQQTTENSPLQFQAERDNQISISDPAGGDPDMVLTLEANQGRMTLENWTLTSRSLEMPQGDGDRDRRITLAGKLEAINQALSSLAFIPPVNFTGEASIKITAKFSAIPGPAGTGSDTVTITVDPPAAVPPLLVPDEESHNAALALVEGKWKTKYEATQTLGKIVKREALQTLARELHSVHTITPEPVMKFVWLKAAIRFAQESVSPQLTFSMIDDCTRQYKIDDLPDRLEAMRYWGKVADEDFRDESETLNNQQLNQLRRELLELVGPLAEQAQTAGRSDIALELRELAGRLRQLGPLTIRNSIRMKLKRIPAGEFTRGAEPGVRIESPFYIGFNEVTQYEYERLMRKNPSHHKAELKKAYPVEGVTWDDANRFCQNLSNLAEEKKAGRVYQLPTETQWEYACRAGTMTAYSFGSEPSRLEAHAWFANNSGEKHIDGSKLLDQRGLDQYLKRLGRNGCRPHRVWGKLPNPWGLYDMHGNVWEWCRADASQGSVRVSRGGGWASPAERCQSTSRDTNSQPESGDRGFRVIAVISHD